MFTGVFLVKITMVHKCCVVKCSKRADRDVGTSFYRLPAVITMNNRKYQKPIEGSTGLTVDKACALSLERQNAWLRAIKRGNFTEKQKKILRFCSNHFISGKPADLADKNNPDWVPCINLGYEVGASIKKKSAVDRHERCTKRLKNKTSSAVVYPDNSELLVELGENFSSEIIETGTASQTELTMHDISKLFEDLTLATTLLEKLQRKAD